MVFRNEVLDTSCFRSLRVPWTTRRLNQSILKEINPEYSLEGLMLKLKLQSLATWCKEPTDWKRPCCWEISKVGGEVGDRGWDGWMDGITKLMEMSLSKFQKIVKDRKAWHSAVQEVKKSQTRLNDSTTTISRGCTLEFLGKPNNE